MEPKPQAATTGDRVVGVLILTHGRMAEELLGAARTISGELEQFDALALDWNDDYEILRRQVGQAIHRLDSGSGVLVLTDLFGGTPSNVAMTFLEPGRVEIVSGVNLPMVVRLACLCTADMPVAELGTWIHDKGRKSICVGSTVPRAARPSRPASNPPLDPCDDSLQ